MTWTTLFAISLAVAADAGTADVQYGLRLDAVSSLQWSGSTVYAEGPHPGTLQTTSGRILALWAGPVSGTFAVQAEETVGLLIGRNVQPIASVGPGAVVRTSRPDVVWVGRTEHKEGRAHLRVHEMRGASIGRQVTEGPGQLLDFDVSVNGTIVYLVSDGRAYLSAAGTAKQVALPQSSSKALRVFMARDETEVSVLFPEALCTATADRREWRCDPFNPAEHAVVRQAWDGHVILEPRADR